MDWRQIYTVGTKVERVGEERLVPVGTMGIVSEVEADGVYIVWENGCGVQFYSLPDYSVLLQSASKNDWDEDIELL
mgnify:CR=1 FL=1